MEFEWDVKKRESNWEKHNVDLLYAALMFEAPDKIEIFEEVRDGEARVTAIGSVDGVFYCLTYVDKGDVYRLITAWKLNERSYEKEKARLARRTARHEDAG